jgi:HAD superfamily hydrolase (TIGR01509 family)
MIKVIAFDYTGVVAPGPFSSWLKKNFPRNDIKHKLFEKHSKRWDIGEVDLDEYYKLISEMSGISPELIWDTFYHNSIYNEEVVGIINKLKKNYKVILFSNHHNDLLRKILEKHVITHLFDEIIVSSEHKMAKPNKDFFHLMLSIAGANKDEVVFIDDNKLNVDQSNKLGIKALLFINVKTLKKDLLNIGIKF